MHPMEMHGSLVYVDKPSTLNVTIRKNLLMVAFVTKFRAPEP